MNSMERVMATMSGAEVDKNPVFAVLGAYGGILADIPLPRLYQDADSWVTGQSNVVEALNTDIVLGFFDHSRVTQAFGGKVAYFVDQAPNMRQPGFQDVQTFLKSPLPDARTASGLALSLECLRKLSQLYNNTMPIAGVIPGFTSLPILIFGMELWMESILFDYENACKVMEKLKDFWKDWLGSIFESGAHFVVLTEGIAEKSVTTRELYESRLHRYTKFAYACSPGPLIFHHNGGCINHLLDLVAELPNLGAVSIGSKDSIKEARELLGQGTTLIGNFDNFIFPQSGIDEVYQRTIALCGDGHKNKPFILCNSGGDLHVDSSIEGLRMFIDTGRSFGKN